MSFNYYSDVQFQSNVNRGNKISTVFTGNYPWFKIQSPFTRDPCWFDRKLITPRIEFTWKYHIDQVARKISKMTGIMAKASHYLSLKTLQTIYDTMVYPYLTYCHIVWTSTYPSRLKSLFMLQKKIVRIMTFENYNEKSRPLFLSLKILNIYELNSSVSGTSRLTFAYRPVSWRLQASTLRGF